MNKKGSSLVSEVGLNLLISNMAINKQKWLLWDLNPRPFGIAPEATALDRSAKQPCDV